MSDLISRQAAIDAMWKALYAYEDLTEKQFMEHEELELEDWFQHRIFVQRMHEECMKAVESLPSAEPKTGKWIPVSEGLPSEGQVVLAIGDKGTWDVGKFQGTAGWTDDERMWNWKKKSVKRVDYWMPKDAIPLPYRKEGE